MPTPIPNVMYKQCDDESGDNTGIASNCSDYNADSNTASTEPTSDSDTDKEDFFVKALPIETFNYKTNNQYTELANFTEEDESNSYIWDRMHMIIPKQVLLASTRTEAWE